jgi:hypothetical protein
MVATEDIDEYSAIETIIELSYEVKKCRSRISRQYEEQK